MTIYNVVFLKAVALIFCLPSSLSAQTFSLSDSAFGADVDVNISSSSFGADVDVYLASSSFGADITFHPKVCSAFDTSDVNIYLSSSSFGADIDVHISSSSFGADVDVHLSSSSFGADYILCAPRSLKGGELHYLAAGAAAYLFEQGLIN